MDLYTMLYFKWITNKILLHMELCSVFGAAWMGEKFGGEWIHVIYVAGPFAVHLQLSQHC